jgi:hypothetical protein
MNIDRLLEQAKREVTRRELKGEDSQAIVNDILNDPLYAEIFEGLNEDETFELCKEIQLGSDEEEYKAYFEDKDY